MILPVSIHKRGLQRAAFVEIVAALDEGGGRQHWCRYSIFSKRPRLHGVVGLFFLLAVCNGLSAGSVHGLS